MDIGEHGEKATSLTGPQRHQPFTPNKKSVFAVQDSRILNKLFRTPPIMYSQKFIRSQAIASHFA